MKKIIIILPIILLVSCGPSLQEKEEIATITCNILGASRGMDAAMRIKEINSARDKLKTDPFLGTDEDILEAFEYDMCKQLVLNDPDYSNKLVELKEVIRIAEEKREEEERIAREKREEEARIAREKREEETRIAREKREEEARIAREKREEETRIAREKNIKKYTNSIKEVLDKYPPNPSLIALKLGFNYSKQETVEIKYRCADISGFDIDIVVKFKNNLGEIRHHNSIGYCSRGTHNVTITNYGNSLGEFNKDIADIFYNKNPESMVESIHILWNGGFYLSKVEEMFEDNRIRREVSSKFNSENYGYVKPDLTILPSKWVIYSSE